MVNEIDRQYLPLSGYVGIDIHCATWPKMTSNETSAKQICDVVVDETMIAKISSVLHLSPLHSKSHSSRNSSQQIFQQML